jgi:tetratricopeptide (TPR) repeat protein
MSALTARTLWNVPYQRNPFFTGREDILSRLEHALRAEQRVALAQPQGVTGLGGIGKTQTVVEYAYRHREEYDAVFWVRADSVTSLLSSMVELAQILELPERNEQDLEMIVRAVLRWLRLHSGWLLVYDNMDDLALAERFLPKAEAGHLLFTTRAHALGELAQHLDIPQMEPEIGALLLLRRANLLALQAPWNMAHPDDRHFALAISQELDGLPLALDQAGAYVKETPCSLPDYLARYHTRRSDLLRTRGSVKQDYPFSVVTTWALSFEQISQANPAAPELLNFCAFLAPDAIPEELLTTGAAHLGAVLAPAVTNPLQFDQVCKEILRFSLLLRGADEHSLTVHRLVQAVLRDSMSTKTQQLWMRRAVPAVNAALPEVEFANWPTYERLVPHALTCITWIEQVPLITPEATHLLHQAGFYLSERGHLREAEPLLVRALAIREQEVGTNHSSTAMSLNSLANLYRAQGKYTQAEPLYQRALAFYEQEVGASHPATASILNNLAALYQKQGKYAQAESLYQRALAIYEQELGASHPHTALILNNLAELYRSQGKYTQAEPLYIRALAISEQEVGASHPDTASSLNNLGLLYESQGKYTQAEPLYIRALAISEQELGASHPDTAANLNNLAELYQLQGRYTEAEPLYQRALAISEQELGASHHATASILNNLAALYQKQGKDAQSEPLLVRALAISERELGASHPSTALILNNLAGLYESQKKYEQAESLYQRALAISEQELGASHPSTALSLNNLAGLYESQKKYEQAEPLYRRALAIYEQELGANHPSTALSLNNLAYLYESQRKYAQSEPLYRRALAIYEQRLGAEHPQTQSIMHNYLMLLSKMHTGGDMEALLQLLAQAAFNDDEEQGVTEQNFHNA